MSSVHANLDLRLWFSYMENIARMLAAIGHDDDNVRFARLINDEQDRRVKTQMTAGPALFAEDFSTRFIDNKSDNLMAQRTVSFTVANVVGKERDEDEILQKQAECEKLGQQILARMRMDRLGQPALKKFADVFLHEAEAEFVRGLFNGNWFGYRVTIPIQNREENLVYDPGQWDDDAGTPRLVDLTGISCENLNDTLYGLTQNQRLNCILPGYDFASDTQFDALTDQQIADLTERLGSQPMILPYANKVAALAATTTVPTTSQLVYVVATKRVYPANGTSTVAQLVTAEEYLLPVHEDNDGIDTNYQGSSVNLQLNA